MTQNNEKLKKAGPLYFTVVAMGSIATVKLIKTPSSVNGEIDQMKDKVKTLDKDMAKMKARMAKMTAIVGTDKPAKTRKISYRI